MTRPQETFTDMLARLFPMPGIQLGINSPHSKCITFQVTEDCNLRCSYCYQGCKTHRKMSLETAKAAVDMLLAADERTNQYITSTEVAGVVLDFIGGEPLLEVELIDQILDYFVAQTFRLHHPWATRWKASMSTNGTLYFRPEVQRFLDKWAKRLSLSISIDGDKQLHDSCRVFPDGSGSYDLAIAAAKDYMTKGNALGSKMTIAPGNVDYLYHAVIGLLDAGYRAINLNCVYEKGWTLDHAATLYTQLKQLADFALTLDEQPYLSIFSESIGHPLPEDDNQNWCGGTGLMLAVDCDGLFFPCLRYMGTSLGHEQRPYTIGDLEHGINVLPEHRARVAEMAAVTRRSQSTDECFAWQPYLSIFSESIGHPLPEDDNQNWCGGTGLMLAVDCDGLFFPCLRYMGTSLGHEQRPYTIGDLEHGINVLPEHRARVAEMAAVTRRSQSTDECFACPIASGCSWCSAYNYQCTGTPDKRVTYICPMHKARVLANAYYWNNLYRKRGDTARYRLDIPDAWALEIIPYAELSMLKSISKEG